MKKIKTPKTFNDLKKHPFVDRIECEFQFGIFDESDHIYLLYLIENKKFECLDSGMITAPTKQRLIDSFNCHKILSI